MSDSRPATEAVPTTSGATRVEGSGPVLLKQLFSGLRQVQAALSAGRDLVQAEFDLLQQELGHPKPEKGILHKAIAIIRHKVTERGEITLSNAGWTLLAQLDELIAQLPEEELV